MKRLFILTVLFISVLVTATSVDARPRVNHHHHQEQTTTVEVIVHKPHRHDPKPSQIVAHHHQEPVQVVVHKPHHHHEPVQVVAHKPHHHHHAIGTVLTHRPAHGHYVRKGHHHYWFTDHTVYRIERVHGQKVYVVVRHLG